MRGGATSHPLVHACVLALSLLQQPAPIEWTEAEAMPAGRDHHVVIAAHAGARPALVVVGGTDYRGVYDQVWWTPVDDGGALEPWRSAARLPEPRAGAVGAAVAGRILVAGGQRPDRSHAAEVWTTAVDAGGPGDWRPGPPLPGPRFHAASAAHGGLVWVTGGQGAAGSESGVFVARLDAGGVGEWRVAGRLDRPRSHHAALVHEGALWVVGGLDGHPARGPALLNDVRRAPILEDGGLGPWELVSMMPHAYATHSAFVHDGALWVLGGVEDNQRFVDTVWRAAFRDDGRLGAWERVEPGLPAARAHVHVTPVIAGRVYSIGGSAMRQVRRAVDVGLLAAPPAR